ncbi:MAG: C45 family autoproteolytic acyltransferase/hydrolase [Planctomycetota bacterium]|jgi:tetratricopeptide (TPR) repeat protein
MPKKRRWLKWLLRIGGGLLLLLAAFLAWVFLACVADPPELDYEPAILAAGAPVADGERMRLGKCWFEERKGRSLLYLEGDPYSIGYANAHLTAELLAIQERHFVQTVKGFFSSRLKLLAVGIAVLVNNRNLPDYVPREYAEEILGIAEGCPDPFPEYGPRYHRILNYHAAHDISHWVHDKPVVGCTAFAAFGEATRDGHLLVGRNFDFEAGRVFDRNKVIACYRPRRGRAFLSVVWPGMAGAITGLNEDRIYCSINGAHSASRDNIGIPVALVVRQVLQYAGSVEEAIEVIRGARVFVSDSYLVADGKTGEAVVVEKSPARTEVRRLDGDLLLQANHFECVGFSDDEGNREYQRVGTSVPRRRRLTELVHRHRGALDVSVAVTILRDRQGPGDKPLALGSRSAINPMIATHSVVADVTAGVLWVSRGPHQLGAYDAYSIAKFGAVIAPPIPADAALTSGRYARLQQARDLIDYLPNEENLRRALKLNPGDPTALHLLAQVLEEAGRQAEALEYYRAALVAEPPFLQDREEIEAAIGRLR